MFHIVHLSAALNQVSNLPDIALDSPRDLIHVLRLHNGFQIILQNLGEVV